MVSLLQLRAGVRVLTPPAAALALGYTRLSFYDDFNSPLTIDNNNTKAQGFNWYRSADWPFGAFNVGTTYSSSNYDVANSILHMNTTQTNVIIGLATACAGASANLYNGTVFTGGAYFEASMAFDPTQSITTNTSWPAFWAFGTNAFIDPTATTFSEPDFFEAAPGVINGTVKQFMAFHTWNVSPLQDRNLNPSISLGGTFNLSTFHKYATSWVPMADNGGTGLIKRYFDDVNVSAANFSYTATTDSTPASSGSNPPATNGVFSDIETLPGLYLILSCGEGVSSYWDYVAVWQKP